MNHSIKDHILSSLDRHADNLLTQWSNPSGTSTKHFVLDNLLPDDIALRANSSFPIQGQGFSSRDDFRERKKTLMDLSNLDPLLSDITYSLQSPDVLLKLEQLTGIRHLEPDPSLSRGGLSMMFKGDFLNPHIDNSHDSERSRYRRLNLLYYVSPEWKAEYGGNFELWNENRSKPMTIVSGFNRFVVMETTKNSWHSVSKVVASSPRCCISSYCYTLAPPGADDYYHVTSFDGRPSEIRRKIVTRLDNALRNAYSKLSGKARG